ncbi:hypothetical protein HHK36_027433 [Tetracentron sinense]|uniref:RRM domain-containing protein n=1 Tax=Tetracentron sinense TaxID=13715 RepID=A0A834YHI4_TETSI|nr:hypothetical protein HHK36_027433 [Tetracentron sinense]
MPPRSAPQKLPIKSSISSSLKPPKKRSESRNFLIPEIEAVIEPSQILETIAHGEDSIGSDAGTAQISQGNETVEKSSEKVVEVEEVAEIEREIGLRNENEGKESEGEEVWEPIKEKKKQKEYEVFVGGLDRDAVEEDLEKVFKKVGEVVEVRLVMNPYSQKNKGFAFVRFATVEQAKRAASEKFTLVRGKVCGVTRNNDNETLYLGNVCTTWTKDKLVKNLKSYELDSLEEVHLIDDANNKGMNRGYAFLKFGTHMDAVTACNKLQKGDVFFGTSLRAEVAFAKSAVEPDEEVMAQVKSVFLDGLPASWDEAQVHDQLKKYGEIENVQLARNMPSAKREDFGFICFRTREAALACIDAVNKDGIGEGAQKVSLKATLRKPLQKRIPPRTNGWRGYSSNSHDGWGLRPHRIVRSSPKRSNRTQFDRGHGVRLSGTSGYGQYSTRGDEFETELSPIRKYGSRFRKELVQRVAAPDTAHRRSRDPYFKSSSSGRHALGNYEDYSAYYSQDPSHELYDDDRYDSEYDYYDNRSEDAYNYHATSGLKRPYSTLDDDVLVSRSHTRYPRSGGSGLHMDSYPRRGVFESDERSRIMPDDRFGYESANYESRYISGSGPSRSYY